MPQRAVQVTPHELIHQHQLRASQTVEFRRSPRFGTNSRNGLVCAVTMQCFELPHLVRLHAGRVALGNLCVRQKRMTPP